MASPHGPREPKDEFVNTTKGFIGVVSIDPSGKEKAIAVRPGASVWLTEAEQILTANAPRNDEDNPFSNGSLRLETRAGDIINRRPIGNQQADPGSENGAEPEVEAEEEQQRQSEEPPQEIKPSDADAKTARRKADEKRQAEEKQKEEDAKAQAKAGAVPAKETGAALDPKGTPKMGKRSSGEEVGTPDAAAAAAAPEKA